VLISVLSGAEQCCFMCMDVKDGETTQAADAIPHLVFKIWCELVSHEFFANRQETEWQAHYREHIIGRRGTLHFTIIHAQLLPLATHQNNAGG